MRIRPKPEIVEYSLLWDDLVALKERGVTRIVTRAEFEAAYVFDAEEFRG